MRESRALCWRRPDVLHGLCALIHGLVAGVHGSLPSLFGFLASAHGATNAASCRACSRVPDSCSLPGIYVPRCALSVHAFIGTFRYSMSVHARLHGKFARIHGARARMQRRGASFDGWRASLHAVAPDSAAVRLHPGYGARRAASLGRPWPPTTEIGARFTYPSVK